MKPNVDNESLVIKDPIYIKSSKSIYIAFDKCFNTNNKNLNQFNINKSAYNKKADEICRYANIFLKYYDKENEFLSGLLSIKYKIDNKSSLYSMSSFISDISEYLFTENVIELIYEMVDDYYQTELSTSEIKNVDLHALQFTNEHCKVIMAISIACKLTIPVVCHYYSIKGNEIQNEKQIMSAINKSLTKKTNKKLIKNLHDISEMKVEDKDIDKYENLQLKGNRLILHTDIFDDKKDEDDYETTPSRKTIQNVQMENNRLVVHIDLLDEYDSAKLGVKYNDEHSDTQPDLKFSQKEFLYYTFLSYYPLFQKNCIIYNKLFVTVENHINQTRRSEKTMWDRLQNDKRTPTSSMTTLMMVAVVDLIPKAVFNKNVIFLIQYSVPKQLETLLKGKDKYEYCSVSKVAKGDELSGLDKIEANNARVSDLDVTISGLTIKNGIKKVAKKYGVKLKKKEIAYYQKNLKNIAFNHLVAQFFADDFGGIYDLRNISKKDHIKLVIIFKKVMERSGYIYINEIITGNASSSVKRRRASSKQMNKIRELPKFKKAMKKYSMSLGEDDYNIILDNIFLLVNTPVEYVNYKHKENYGQIIKADIELVTMEYLKFINMI